MKTAFIAFLCGICFALGLGISGMTQPAKVIGFLDLTGNWDPSLIFVMMGAILVYAVGHFFVVKKPTPIFAGAFDLPSLRKLDRPLILGSAIFGTGWGLAGFCPGPALTSVISLRFEPLVFVLSMLVGMAIFIGSDRLGKKT